MADLDLLTKISVVASGTKSTEFAPSNASVACRSVC